MPLENFIIQNISALFEIFSESWENSGIIKFETHISGDKHDSGNTTTTGP
jgi:hypothetical protein